MSDALDVLATTVDGHDAAATSAAAISVGHAGFDLQLQTRSPADVDRNRLELWAWQLELDQAAGDDALIASDQVIIETIRQRIGRA